MTEARARAIVPVWASEEVPIMHPVYSKARAEDLIHDFKKKHGILLICSFVWAFTMILGCCLTGWIVRENTAAQVWEEAEAAYSAQLESFKAEQAKAKQAEYFLSGEASLEAQINQEADELARATQIFTTTRAKESFIWNVIVRVLSPLYPNSVKEVLAQDGQFDFYSESNMISESDRQIAIPALRMMHEGRLPAGLTMNHLYGEMRENGADYVLRTQYLKTPGDDYWRMPEQ